MAGPGRRQHHHQLGYVHFTTNKSSHFYSPPLSSEGDMHSSWACRFGFQSVFRCDPQANFYRWVPGGIGSCASSSSSPSVPDDSVDFPNPILTCIERVGLPTSSSFAWIREKWPVKSVLSFFRSRMLHLSSECWHARCSHHSTRETGSNHPGGAFTW